jgi:hypothetical protein
MAVKLSATLEVPYTKWTFLSPPRPETVIASSSIGFYEARGFLGQYKKNGTCTLIGVDPEGGIHHLTRHNELHKRWQLTDKTRKLADYAPKGVWTVFVAELLNEKTPHIKDTLYIFDVVVADSAQLIGTTFIERQGYLTDLFKTPISETDSHYVMTDNLWLAKPIITDLEATFALIRVQKDTSNEGLVLKDPAGVLEMMRPGSNQAWQVKVRKPVPNSCRGM